MKITMIKCIFIYTQTNKGGMLKNTDILKYILELYMVDFKYINTQCLFFIQSYCGTLHLLSGILFTKVLF